MDTVSSQWEDWYRRKGMKNAMKRRVSGLRRSGMNVRQISKTLGISQTAVRFLI